MTTAFPPAHCSPATAAQIETALRQALRPSALQVIDESARHAGHAGTLGQTHGTHFKVRIAAPVFAGHSRLACHRLVYDALRPFINQGLHALAIEIDNG